MAHYWSKEEVTVLYGMAGYYSTADIAKRLGKSIKSVSQKAQKEGLSLRLFENRITKKAELSIFEQCRQNLSWFDLLSSVFSLDTSSQGTSELAQ